MTGVPAAILFACAASLFGSRSSSSGGGSRIDEPVAPRAAAAEHEHVAREHHDAPALEPALERVDVGAAQPQIAVRRSVVDVRRRRASARDEPRRGAGRLADGLRVDLLDRLARARAALCQRCAGSRASALRHDVIDAPAGCRASARASTARRARPVRCFVSTPTAVEPAIQVLAGQQLEHQRAERVDVAARVDLVAADLLGRHEVRRADDLLPIGLAVGARALVELREPEVEHLRVVAPAGRCA